MKGAVHGVRLSDVQEEVGRAKERKKGGGGGKKKRKCVVESRGGRRGFL
jgi:hypothetical protein